MSQASVSACYTLQPIHSPLQFWNVIVGIQKFVLRWHQVVLQVQQLLKHWIERFNMFQSNQITKISCFSSSKRSVTFIPSCSFIRESYSLSSCRHKTETFIIISVVKCKTDAQTELFLTHSFTFFITLTAIVFIKVPVKSGTLEVRDKRLIFSLTSCSILYSLSLLASFSSASLQAFCADSSSCRTFFFKRAVRASFSLPERLLSSSRCCKDFTVAPAAAYRSGHSA